MKFGVKIKFTLFLLIAILMACTTAGCYKPFHEADLREITPSQTAYLIPLEGQTSKQKAFDSAAFLDQSKIATKRVEIPYRWKQTGRETWIDPNNGKWIPSMTLIVVERKPVTREWTEKPTDGTSVKNEGIGAETLESIGFMARMNCSAQIDEKDASLYLYRYNGKPLEDVMDSDIRPRVESKFVELAALYRLNEDKTTGILANKSAVMEKVRQDVLPFFKERGINITVLGLKGDFTYDPEVQKAINQRFASIQQRSKADNDAYTAQKLKASGGLEYQLKLQEMEIKRTNAETARNISLAMKDGKVKMPEVVAGNGAILGVNLQNLGKE